MEEPTTEVNADTAKPAGGDGGGPTNTFIMQEMIISGTIPGTQPGSGTQPEMRDSTRDDRTREVRVGAQGKKKFVCLK